jgi:photosystem II stability/assembly factor-like uncharacterized protein
MRSFRFAVLSLSLVVVPATEAPGTLWNQTELPFFNANARDLAVSPTESGRVFLATTGGVYRTVDAGLTWALIVDSPTLDVLEASPHDANLMLGASGASLYRTTNGGAGWEQVAVLDILPHGSIEVLAFHPSSSAVAFAGTSPPGAETGLHRTTDAGDTWSFLGSPDGSGMNYLAIHPASPNIMLVARGPFESGSFRSTDGGFTWTSLADNYHGFAFSEPDPNRVYAFLGEGGWFGIQPQRSSDGGATFTPVGDLPGDFPLALHAVTHPTDPDGALAGGEGDFCGFGPGRGQAWRTTDGGASWSDVLATECDEGDIRTLAYDAEDPTHVYLAESSYGGTGFRHSSDGGATWSVRVDGIRNHWVHQIGGDHLSTNYVRLTRRILRSSGSVGTWTDRGEVFDVIFFLQRTALEVPFSNANRVFLAGDAVDGDVQASFALESSDGGTSWSGGVDPEGLPEWARVYDAATDWMGVDYMATNSGLFVATGELPYALTNPSFTDVRLALHPANSLEIFIANGPHTVERSVDAGASSVPRNSGLPPVGGDLSIEELFISPVSPNLLVTVYSDGRVYETVDAALSWTLQESLDLEGSSIVDVSWDFSTRDVFLVRFDGQLVTSHPDYAAGGLPGRAVSVHCSSLQDVLLVGTSAAGLFHQVAGAAVGVDSESGGPVSVPDFTATPVPTSSGVTFRFRVPAPGAGVSLSVFDVRGRLVTVLLDRRLDAGSHQVSWGGANPSGVYFARLRIGDDWTSRKVILAR